MVSVGDKSASPAFAPSPPLSGPDSDHGEHKLRVPRLPYRDGSNRQGLSGLPARHETTDLSPCSSFASSISTTANVPAPSVISSFTSCKEEQGRGRSGTRRTAPPPDDLDRAVSVIQASWRGSLPPEAQRSEWCVFHVSPAQFLELRKRLGASSPQLLSYFDNDLRFDYDPDRALLVLRLMACALHEYMKDATCSSIHSQLRQIANDSTSNRRLRDLASSIKSLGHSTVDFKARRSNLQKARARKSPDGQYRFLVRAAGQQRSYFNKSPPFVIEVGYSQNAEELEQLAKDYYEQSNGTIKTVLTIDLKYMEPKTRRVTNDYTATLCLYRGPERVCHDTAFCNTDGEAIEGCVDLSLADFIPDTVLEELSRSSRQAAERTTVRLPFRDLCEHLREAVLAQEAEDETEAEDEPGQSGPTASQQPMKRVHWEMSFRAVTDDDNGTAQGAEAAGEEVGEGEGEGEDELSRSGRSRSASRCKRRRIGSVRRDRGMYQGRSRSVSGERRRTRSMTRGSQQSA